MLHTFSSSDIYIYIFYDNFWILVNSLYLSWGLNISLIREFFGSGSGRLAVEASKRRQTVLPRPRPWVVRLRFFGNDRGQKILTILECSVNFATCDLRFWQFLRPAVKSCGCDPRNSGCDLSRRLIAWWPWYLILCYFFLRNTSVAKKFSTDNCKYIWINIYNYQYPFISIRIFVCL